MNFSIISSTGDKEKDMEIHLENQKWSDINISLPVIFCFYHGVELFLKAILFDLDVKYKPNHKITDLLNKLEDQSDDSLNKVILAFKNIMTNNPFNQHFLENKKGINEFYHILKYAEDLKGNYTTIGSLLSNEKEGLENFKTIRSQIHRLKAELIEWRKSQIESKHEN